MNRIHENALDNIGHNGIPLDKKINIGKLCAENPVSVIRQFTSTEIHSNLHNREKISEICNIESTRDLYPGVS